MCCGHEQSWHSDTGLKVSSGHECYVRTLQFYVVTLTLLSVYKISFFYLSLNRNNPYGVNSEIITEYDNTEANIKNNSNLPTYLLTFLLKGAESFLRSQPISS